MSAGRPKVSCLMVTADRRRFVRRALLCYRRQTYPHRELVIVDDGREPLDDLLTGFAPGEVLYHRLARNPGNVLGRLRNISLELATGDLCANWDDDDWYHPDRLAVQVAALVDGARSCSLAAALVHLDAAPYSRHAFVSPFRHGVPGSLVYPRSGAARHPEVRRGEDDALLREWRKSGHRRLDASRAGLMVRCFHGANTWDMGHFLGRLRTTLPDALRYAWCRRVLGDVRRHRLFRLPEAAGRAFALFLEDSRALGLLREDE
jgi:glycosyltransferase involved in cell wall biosynthesis